MKKQNEDTQKTQLDEDMDVFEEWEEGEAPAKADEADAGPEKEPATGESEIPEVAEPESEPDKEFVTDPQVETPDTGGDFTDLAPDVPVSLVAVIGKKTTSVGDLIKLRVGNTVDLGRPPNETVDLIANGRLLARGELVEMDGKLGVKILKLVR